jgi:hypothetical protein
MAESYATLNDYAASWPDTKVHVTPYGGAMLEDLDAAGVTHSGTVEVGVQMHGGRVKARTSGSATYEATLTLYRSAYERVLTALRDAASASATRGNQILLSQVAFDVDVQVIPPGATAPSAHVRIKGCRLLGYSDSMSEGNDAQQIEITLNPMEIVTVKEGQELVLR